jgi:hypothetical protein
MNRRFGVILVVVLAFLLIGLLVLYLRLKSIDLGLTKPANIQPAAAVLQHITEQVNDPITKLIKMDNSEVIYRIRGYFLQPPIMEGKMMVGNFVVDGDTKERSFKVFLGAWDGNAFWGNYEGQSFNTSVNWAVTPTNTLAGKIQAKQPIILHWTLRLTPGDRVRVVTAEKAVNVLESLLSDIRSGKGTFNVPLDFYVATEKFGTHT